MEILEKLTVTPEEKLEDLSLRHPNSQPAVVLCSAECSDTLKD